MSSVKFSARIWFSAEYVEQIEVWVDLLDPMSFDKRPGAEWVSEYLNESLSANDFLEIIGKPTEDKSCYQLLLHAELNGYRSFNGESYEYDEDMEVEKVEFVEVPEDYYVALFFDDGRVNEEEQLQ